MSKLEFSALNISKTLWIVWAQGVYIIGSKSRIKYKSCEMCLGPIVLKYVHPLDPLSSFEKLPLKDNNILFYIYQELELFIYLDNADDISCLPTRE